MSKSTTRKPGVAGQFYPREPHRLRETVEEHLEAATVSPAPERVVALVAPHAGYIYSGPTAGYAYARVRGKKPSRVVLLGCSHRHYVDTASVYTGGAFETPLGTMPIDDAFAQALAKKAESASVEPHLLEHSLEVQLPFLQMAIGHAPIVPVLFGARAGNWHGEFGAALAEMVDDSDLVVASTDLSHYLRQEEAERVDKESINAVLRQDWVAFNRESAAGRCSLCGTAAVTVAMAFALARSAKTWKLLDYRTSAAASGDYDRVVGYAAISMERDA